MGRALFSQNYATAPTSQSGGPDVRAYETWSKSNLFDPDSDDFFVDAVYEAFVDHAEYERQREEQLREEDEENRASIVMQIDTDSGVSLSSGSPVLSSRGSPMAVGADDPAAILADAGYASPSEWDRSSSTVSGYTGWMHMGRIAVPDASTGYVPPLSMEDEILALRSAARRNRLRSTSISAPQDQLPTIPSRRTVTITPIDLTPVDRRPSVPRSPSPAPLLTPPRRENVQLPDLVTPSPAPTVTPHIYRWHTSPAPWMSPIPRSVTAPVAQASPSPLPNPSARVSHSRIALAPVHMRMQSAAI
ncbi:hypothetical protein AX14_002681 [Amanita brunnescens Koide BX004]|nr:hypothetical protein AX14_002681 [Amanita brunnescens Koide BX004]